MLYSFGQTSETYSHLTALPFAMAAVYSRKDGWKRVDGSLHFCH